MDKDRKLIIGGGMWGLRSKNPARTMATRIVGQVAKIPLYVAGRLARRDRRLWVFGNSKGYRDNPRFLAEYVLNDRPELDVWWLARTAWEAEAARKAGLKVAMLDSRKAGHLQRHAGVAFYCNSFNDLQLTSVAGAYVVHLYHGTALKRISLDVDRSRFTRKSRLLGSLARVSRWVLKQKHRNVDMYVAGGELARARYVTAFGADARKVMPLGAPRFDVIRGGRAYERVAGGDLRAQLGFKPDDRIVLWLPTWREQGDEAWLPTLDQDVVERHLGQTNITLLVKNHPFAEHEVYRQRLPDHPRVRLLEEQQFDVNCLLHIADELITDYSSAMFDYAILERPIHLLAPDVETYSAGRDLYEPYETLTAGLHHRDWDSLLRELRDGSSAAGVSSGSTLTRRVADYARNNTEPEVCRRIVDRIVGEIGIA